MRQVDAFGRVSRSVFVVLLALAGPLCSPARAGVVTDAVLFGDSLSDMGNFYSISDAALFVPALPQSPPFHAGRFSNGPVWIEHVTAALQLPALAPSRNGGMNYAYGSAKTGTGSISYTFFSIPNIGSQVSQFTSSRTLRPDQLVVLWGGANDLIDNPAIDPAVPVANLAARISELRAVGGRQFFVPNLPPLGKAPRFVGGPSEATMNSLTTNFNALLSTQLAALETSLGVTIQQFNVQQVFQGVLNNPAAFGLTNVTGQALSGGTDLGGTIWNGTVVPNPGEYLFWDSLHPTAVAHTFLGAAATKEFALHTNTSRNLALLRQWVTTEDLTGEFHGDGNLEVVGAWNCSGALVKRGQGILALDLASGFATGPNASLAINGGAVRLAGEGQTLLLASLTFDAEGHTLRGARLKVTGPITNKVAAAVIESPLELAGGGVVDGGSAAGNTLTITGQVSGTVGLTKTGAGKVVLTQAAAYSGNTVVNAGVLEILGLSNSGSTTIGAGTVSAELFTASIRQTSLTIHDQGKVTITGGGGASGTSVIGTLTIALPGNGVGRIDNGVEAVPEPATLGMLVIGGLIAWFAWRKRGA